MKTTLVHLSLLRLKILLIFMTLCSCSPGIYALPMSLNAIVEPCASGFCAVATDTLPRIEQFDHSEGKFDFYTMNLALFGSSYERLYFYEKARERGINIADKNDFHADSPIFSTMLDKDQVRQELRELYEMTLKAGSSVSEADKIKLVQSSPFYSTGVSEQPPGLEAPMVDGTLCSEASVSCSGNVYTFPAGTSGSAPAPVGGYPNYGCLGSQPCPSWYYMQVGAAGDIIIDITQSGNFDVDFICWGPFTSLTDGCSGGLNGTCSSDPLKPPTCCNNNSAGCANFYPRGNIVDCSYSNSATETCHILNAQVGEIYILLMTNFSQQPAEITFSQTGGTGITNCNIVVFCSMIALTTNTTPCNAGTNTFAVSGNVEFSNPSPTGTLTVTDMTAVPPVSQSFNAPFISPLAYNLTNIPCDGLPHTIKAVFTDSLNCTIEQPFNAPQASCPSGVISGGGVICDDGVSQATVSINISGSPGPYDFTISINGNNQPPVSGYNGPMPYQINTTTPGVYTLVNLTNAVCPTGGIVSGDATVTVNPLPVLNFPASSTCIDQPPYPLSSATPTGGTYSGPGVTAGVFDPAAAGAGQHSISYTYTDLNNCTNSISQNLTVYALPVVSLQPFSPVCQYVSPFPLVGGSPAGGTYSGPGVTAGLFDPAAAGVGNHAITYTYADINGCVNFVSQTIEVSAMAAVGLASFPGVCIDTPGFILTGGTPPGGTYSGAGVSNGFFDPSVSGTGNHTITYTYADANGCTGNAVNSIQVSPLPFVDFTGVVVPLTVCQDNPTSYRYQVPADPLTTYAWSIPPPFSGKGTIIPVAGFPNMADLNWTSTGAAKLTLIGTTNTGCTDIKTKDIFINPKPVVSITPCFDLVTVIGARPFLLKGGSPLHATATLQGEYLITPVTSPSPLRNDGAGNYFFDPAQAQVATYSISYKYTSTQYGCPAISSTSVSINVLSADASCGPSMTDPRDGSSYSVNLIGGRCWMTENLRYGARINTPQPSKPKPQTDNCVVEKYCLTSDLNCTMYGGLYQWDELVQYGQTASPWQGVCPPAWHVPSKQEWQALIDAVANRTPGDAMAGGYLKDPGVSQGFHALLNGIYYLNNSWEFIAGTPTATMYWTSTLALNKPIARALNTISPSVAIYHSSKANAFPVRCIKD